MMPEQRLEEGARGKAAALHAHGQRLKGHTVLVTGGDSGIGQSIAIACAKEGANVIVTYHSDEEGAKETMRAVEDTGATGRIEPLDQSDPDQVARLFERVAADMVAPTILVNNAGIDASGKEAKDLDPEEWDRVIRTDLSGPFYCTRAFVRTFLDAYGSVEGEDAPDDPATWTRGVIINISSIHDRVPYVGAAGYDAAKGGLKNLTRTLALELAPERIRVVSVSPGMILTPINQQAIDDPEARKEQESAIPMRRAGRPSEIAQAVVFLASPDASYIHGATLYVDGGLMQNQGQGA